MIRRCFSVPKVDVDTKTFDLPASLSHKLESVLRARVGESIELLDGEGSAWECLIAGIRRGKVSVTVVGKLDRQASEPHPAITLGVGFARSDKMDLVVRQATEMGVVRLAIFRAARSQYGLGGLSAERKKERWAKIACEAVCQCGRAWSPDIEIFEDLGRFLDSEAGSTARCLRIFGLERDADNKIVRLPLETGEDIDRVLAVIGPEGGWDKVEVAALTRAGFKPVSLGPRILRMETAAVALVSSIQLLWGDMGDSPLLCTKSPCESKKGDLQCNNPGVRDEML